MYRALIADPPWSFGDSLPGKSRGASKNYDCMTVEEICSFELPALERDCWLFLWRPATHQAEAMQVARAWGFKGPAQELIWRKVTEDGRRLALGMGRGFRNVHETCLVFKRGRPKRLSAALPSMFSAPRYDHSAKPEKFYRLVDQFCPGPKVELFARRQWKDWTCLGLEMPEAVQ
jgi:N6-adenosine-specific RNA methylase IME4